MRYIASIILLFLVACQSELPIEVPNTAGLPVIQANLSHSDSMATVRLTRTVNLSAFDTVVIDNAVVEMVNSVTDERILLDYVRSGYYASPKLMVLAVGQRWRLSVAIGDDQYRAESTILDEVPIDSLRLAKRRPIFGVVSDSAYTAYVWFTDPAGENFYHIRTWINDELKTKINVFNDVLFDGRSQMVPINVSLKAGDRFRVELQHISAEIFRYYYELKQAQSAITNSPANPTSNLEQIAGVRYFEPLGYFSAYSASQATAVRSGSN